MNMEELLKSQYKLYLKAIETNDTDEIKHRERVAKSRSKGKVS